MTDLVSVCSSISFGNDSETFVLPYPLIIEPALILDETEGVYRVSIGSVNIPDEAAEEYQRLFNALNKRMPFVENMHIQVADEELTFKLAYVMRYVKPYGTFYDIEATKKDLKYSGRE